MGFNPEPITPDVRLQLSCAHGTLYDMPLQMTAIMSPINDGVILPFVYDRCVPDEEGNHTPDIRKARLIIIDDGPV